MDRDHLVPVLVMDRNGTMTTKYMRPDEVPKSAPSPAAAPKEKLPPPLIGVAELTKVAADDSRGHRRFLQGLSKQKAVKAKVSDWRLDCDTALRDVCSGTYNPETKFRCTGAEIYDVMNTVDAANVLPLMSVGVRSGEEAREFLNEHQLGHLIIDNARSVVDRIDHDTDPFFTLTYMPLGGSGSSSSMSTSAKIALSPTIPYQS